MQKMKIKFLLIISVLSILHSAIIAQNNQTKKWGIETELIQPFLPTINIVRIQATRIITESQQSRKDALLLGAYIRPNIKHDVVEKIDEYMAVVGYRQFFWKGLHLEAKSNMGYAMGTKNLVDGKNYETATWFWETNVGYKMDLVKKQKINYYAIAQFGGIGNLYADIGPRGGKPDNFMQGNLLIGINF
jgi:hypothetical protein